jgi:hypothetical protein
VCVREMESGSLDRQSSDIALLLLLSLDEWPSDTIYGRLSHSTFTCTLLTMCVQVTGREGGKEEKEGRQRDDHPSPLSFFTQVIYASHPTDSLFVFLSLPVIFTCS